MARISFVNLVDNFVGTLERSGATVIRTKAQDKERPASLRVLTSDGATDCLIFLWTITPGGGGEGVRPASERRIQITNAPPMPLKPGVRTFLGGYSVESGVYAFWDVLKHTRFSANSPSLQVSVSALENAASQGIATHVRNSKRGNEVVVAVSQDSLLWYVQNGLPLHNSSDDAVGVSDLVQATPEVEREFLDTAENEDQASRRYQLVETMRAYRDARFRPAVLRAYRHQCAVCGCALKLVDAAHIVPVSHPQSTDCVTNGIALCRLHHGAYDNALLGITSRFTVIVNPSAEDRLAALNLNMGIDEFKQRLRSEIVLPSTIEVRPSPENFITGLRARHWPEGQIV